jgi:hypothetical protein
MITTLRINLAHKSHYIKAIPCEGIAASAQLAMVAVKGASFLIRP